MDKNNLMYKLAVTNTEGFWAEQANSILTWSKPWHTVTEGSFLTGNVRWFSGGALNACYNCVDRHLPTHSEKIAFIFEQDEPGQSIKYTYKEVYDHVVRFANVLKKRNVKKGDRVCIYMPMIPEAVFAMLACARIGAVHSVVFAGFSATAVENRILDADAQCIVTADEGVRGGKLIHLKRNIDKALKNCPKVHTVLVVKRTGNEIHWNPDKDVWYHEIKETVDANCPPEEMDSEDPLFILYTSGSTGTPKGILHTHAGYLLYAALTFSHIFNYQPNDIFWCTADVGWITGHSYIVYGPMANAATSVLYEGVPNYPTASRFWQIIDAHQVNIFYTAPTAIRALMREGNDHVTSTSRNSLKLLGSVGEPINPEAWRWYHDVVGEKRCKIVDTWWQTETGGILISPTPDDDVQKPGAATQPFFGIVPALIDNDGQLIAGAGEGSLVITKPWPGIARTIYGNHARYIGAYFSLHPGYYTTGDNARRDRDGDYWITGRADDVINVSGHRLSTAEIESALVSHHSVAEAAVVAMPHDIKGHGIYAFVTLKKGAQESNELEKAVKKIVRTTIGGLAVPDVIQWAPQLPKTRSGKIMRRILRKIVENDTQNLGDTSTLADPSVIDELILNRSKKIR